VIAVADALTVFEVDHELCSANLPAAPHVPESAIDQALETLHLRGATAPLEKTQTEPELPVVSEPQPTLTIPSEPPSRKSMRPSKRTPSKPSRRWFETLRSRRVRIIAMSVGVLFVVGLIGWNWHGSSLPNSSDELADMELLEFQDDLHIRNLGVAHGTDLRPLGEETDATVLTARSESRERLPHVGLVNHSEQRGVSAGIQTLGGSNQPTARGSQAAWLTGQIEFESADASLGGSSRRSKGPDVTR
jgi:hypothetical protein